MQHKSAVGDFRVPGVTKPKPFLVASLLAAITAVIGGALLYGPTVRASLDRRLAVEIEHESSEVCTSLGMVSASSRSTCAEALARVRRLDEDRMSRESIL